ncbi:MAG: (2Fe-2S)-binding protein [Bacteroidales bacterium]|nr:(2Fe-2S)-binding protein [Bacteroidales bacterium]MBN2748900.1 (2Fe-2S)-binding protein [Bacteroidales bacterium]
MKKGTLCHCKEVKASVVRSKIRKLELDSIIDVQLATGAATGCGRCRPDVQAMLDEEMLLRVGKGHQLKLRFE